MSLSYVNSCSLTPSTPRKALDDNYIRTPVILAAEQVNPLTTPLHSDYTSRTWRLATVGKDKLVEGHRLENALWRVWAQQRLGLRRMDNMEIDWEKLTAWKHKSLLGPVVISNDTCIHSIELSVASTLLHPMAFEDHSVPVAQTAVNLGAGDLGVPIRPCLRHRSTSPGDVSSVNSYVDDRSSSSPSRPHRVLFNKCVVQSIIKEDWESSDQDEVSDYELDSPGAEDYFNGVHSYSGTPFVEELDSPHQYDHESNLSRCSTIIASNYFPPSIEPLPPVQLHPAVIDGSKDGNVVFVPPPGMETLSEAELLPSEKPLSMLHRTRSSNDLTAADEANLEMETKLEDLSQRVSSPTMNGESDDGDEDAVVLRPERRRRRSRGLFTLGDGAEDAEERGRGRKLTRSQELRMEEHAVEEPVVYSFASGNLVMDLDKDDILPLIETPTKLAIIFAQLAYTSDRIGRLVGKLWS